MTPPKPEPFCVYNKDDNEFYWEKESIGWINFEDGRNSSNIVPLFTAAQLEAARQEAFEEAAQWLDYAALIRGSRTSIFPTDQVRWDREKETLIKAAEGVRALKGAARKEGSGK